MGSACSNHISTHILEYDIPTNSLRSTANDSIEEDDRSVTSSYGKIALRWAYIGLPVYFKGSQDSVGSPSVLLVISIPTGSELNSPSIHWGKLKIMEQVPATLPSQICSRTFVLFAVLMNTDPITTVVTLRGRLDDKDVTEYAYVNTLKGGGLNTVMDTLQVVQKYIEESRVETESRYSIMSTQSSLETGYGSTRPALSLEMSNSEIYLPRIGRSKFLSTTSHPLEEIAESESQHSNKTERNRTPRRTVNVKRSPPNLHRSASNVTLNSVDITKDSPVKTDQILDGHRPSIDESEEVPCDLNEEIRKNSFGLQTSWCDILQRRRSSTNGRRLSNRRKSSDITLSDSTFEEEHLVTPKIPRNPRLRKRSYLALKAFQEICAMTDAEKKAAMEESGLPLQGCVRRVRKLTPISKYPVKTQPFPRNHLVGFQEEEEIRQLRDLRIERFRRSGHILPPLYNDDNEPANDEPYQSLLSCDDDESYIVPRSLSARSCIPTDVDTDH